MTRTVRLGQSACAFARPTNGAAAIPASSMYLTPSLLKNHGITSMKKISDIWPRVIFPAALATPSSFRNGFVNV